MKGMCSSLGEIGAKTIASDVFHLVFVRQRGDSALWILAGKLFVEEDEVGEPPADF